MKERKFNMHAKSWLMRFALAHNSESCVRREDAELLYLYIKKLAKENGCVVKGGYRIAQESDYKFKY